MVPPTGFELRQGGGFRSCASQDASQCQDAVTTRQAPGSLTTLGDKYFGADQARLQSLQKRRHESRISREE